MPATKFVLNANPYLDDAKPLAHHFFASSAFDWRTDADPLKLIQQMERLGYPFQVYYVPLPADASYKISAYEPIVDGTIFLAAYKIK